MVHSRTPAYPATTNWSQNAVSRTPSPGCAATASGSSPTTPATNGTDNGRDSTARWPRPGPGPVINATGSG
ncbi:hypothetical protein GCM10009757_05580 [Streptomyces cheonanensis]|uniref:Uncharacterized protein n=1 Tax=Streptomyces cheonanensis TaxID=312720 RepID=A0ABP5G9A4_9ACTN